MTTLIQSAIEALPRYEISGHDYSVDAESQGEYLLRSDVIAALQAAPAPGSIDTDRFAYLLDCYDRASDAPTGGEMTAAYKAIVTHIDAHIAQRAAMSPDALFLQQVTPQEEAAVPGKTALFPITICGTPMREYATGKWENAEWPSERAASGDEVAGSAPVPVEAGELPQMPDLPKYLKTTNRGTPLFYVGQMIDFARAYGELCRDTSSTVSRVAITPDIHSDDIAVDRFAAALKAEMAEQQAKGRSGWDDPAQCHVQDLAISIVRQIDNGNLLAASNYAMMLFNRGAWPADLVGAMSLHIQSQRRAAPAPIADEVAGDGCDRQVFSSRICEKGTRGCAISHSIKASSREEAEARQRDVLARRSAGRATTPATADFDLPAPSDAPKASAPDAQAGDELPDATDHYGIDTLYHPDPKPDAPAGHAEPVASNYCHNCDMAVISNCGASDCDVVSVAAPVAAEPGDVWEKLPTGCWRRSGSRK